MTLEPSEDPKSKYNDAPEIFTTVHESILSHSLDFTLTPKVRRMIAFMAIITGFRAIILPTSGVSLSPKP